MHAMILDLETRPDPAIQNSEDWWLHRAGKIEPDGRIKDPVKQAARTTEKLDEERARMALSPITGLIACVGFQCWEDGEPTLLTVQECNREHEATVLREFASAMPEEPCMIVTWNGKRFDLPFMIARCMVHGIQLPWWSTPRNYRLAVDLMDDLGLAGPMEDYRFAMGGSFKTVTGEALLSLPLPELEQHCREDLADLMAMATRTQYVWMPRGRS